MRPGPRIVATLLLGGALTGCGGVPATRYYVLEGADSVARGGRETGTIVGVRTFAVDPPYDQDRIAYRLGRDGVELGFYAHHRWAAPLSRLLSGAVAARLDGAAGLGAVEPAVSGRPYVAYLDGRVRAVEEIDLEDGQIARVRLDLRLTRADGTELWSSRVVGETPVQAERVSEIVRALAAALDRAIAGVQGEIARAVVEARPATPARAGH